MSQADAFGWVSTFVVISSQYLPVSPLTYEKSPPVTDLPQAYFAIPTFRFSLWRSDGCNIDRVKIPIKIPESPKGSPLDQSYPFTLFLSVAVSLAFAP